MTGEGIAPVGIDEDLARFIFSSRHIRKTDGTASQNAFIPAPDGTLSVVRHDALEEPDLWSIGRAIGDQRGRTLHGRADSKALEYERYSLKVVAAPTELTEHHAEVREWPPEKPKQKAIAVRIAAAAGQVKVPPAS
jgi:hypothetical protein